MKTFFLTLCLLVSLAATAQVEWLSWEEAIERNQTEPRKLLVDVYTDWCGWCKKMDKAVFADPAIAQFISENFYAIKLDAEQKENIVYKDHTFKFRPDVGRRGSHELAISLLDQRLSFPSIVYLDENESRITISPGFKPAEKYINELRFIQGGHYKTKSYQDYLSTLGK